MTMLSKPSAEKTRALRAAVASYMDHIGLHDRAEFMRAQPDDFTQWSDYAHQLVTVMDKPTFQADLPANIEGMMDFSKSRVAARTEKNRALEGLAEGIGEGKKGRPQSENVDDRQDKGRLPVEPSLLAQALAGAQEIGERGQRGFGKIIAALMGDSENDTPQPRSKEDLARNIRGAYGAEAWGVPSPMTIDKHAWDAAGQPFGGAWYDRGEQLMKDAWLEANRKDQSTVGGDYGFDPPGVPRSANERDLDGDGTTDFAGQFAAGGRKGKKGKARRGKAELKSMPTTPGSIVTSPVSGTVVAFHPDFRSWRGTAFIKGEDGSYTVVSGLQSGTVKSGDQVNAGDPIGIAGNDVGVGQKGPDGSWNQDPSGLLDGIGGTEMAGDPVSPNSGLLGPTDPSGDYGLDGGDYQGGLAPAKAYADAVARGTTPNPSAMAKALAAPSMDGTLMGGTPAQSPNAVPDNDLRFSLPGLETPLGEDDAAAQAPQAPPAPSPYGMDEAAEAAWGAAKSLLGPAAPDEPAFERGMPAPNAFDNAYDSAEKAITDAWGGVQGLFGGSPTDNSLDVDISEGTKGQAYADAGLRTGPLGYRGGYVAAPAASPFSMDAIKGVEGLLGAPASTDVNSAASKALAAALASQPADAQTLVGPTSDWASPALNAFGAFGSETNYGTPSTALADVDPMTAFTRDISAPPAAPSMSLSPSQMTTAYNGFGQFGDEAKYGMSDIDASIATDPMTSFTRSMDVAPAMVAGDPMGESMGFGSFNGIGAPTAAQAEAQRGMPGLSMGAMSGAPSVGVPSQKADLYSPGVGQFSRSLRDSIKPDKIGPGLKAALAAALNSPSDEASLALARQSEKYGLMNGQPSKAVRALRAEQIANFAMANPAIANAYGLSMGQQGPPSVQGGAFGDPFGGFGRGFGGPSGPAAGPGGGYGGGGPGQPSGPSFSGPSGPSGGAGGGYGGGTSGGQPSGPPGVSGPSGPGAGPGGSYGGGNPGGSPSPGGVVSGRGPGSNPGTGGGLSAGARAAIGAALAGAADAAASSDAARGFGGPVGPSFGGLGGGWF